MFFTTRRKTIPVPFGSNDDHLNCDHNDNDDNDNNYEDDDCEEEKF